MTKKIYVDVLVSLQKAPITVSPENLPDSRCSAHGQKYDYFLSNKTFQVLIIENVHITKSYLIKFLVILRTTERIYKI